MPNLF